MQSCLDAIPESARRVLVAYSGGLDSSVLLHLAHAASDRFQLLAWHVNHGLVDCSEQMEAFCIEQVRQLGIEIRLDRLDLGGVESNIEAAARHARYRLFGEHSRQGDCILTAHHADDQSETFLLNALRGSGSAGLRGIARQRKLGNALLFRPLLDCSRSDLENYATRHGIGWFDDPSNRSARYDRNFLRMEVMPLLRKRWPAASRTLGTCSEIQSETQDLLDEIAATDYPQASRETSDGIDTLDIEVLLSLSPARCKNLLRYWVKNAGMDAIPRARMSELLAQLHARKDSQPEIRMPDYSIRIYDRRLFLVTVSSYRISRQEFEFGLDQQVEIAELNLRLVRAEIFERLGIDDRKQALCLVFRQSGRLHRDNHRLKRLFQRYRVPPWKRDRVAQVYLDGRLEGILT